MPSLSKNEIKFIQSLQRKKNRKIEGATVIEGEKLIEEAIKAKVEFRMLFVTDGVRLESSPIEARLISKKEMEQITLLSSASPALAVINTKEAGWGGGKHQRRVLALDDISDPGNLGTILRTADWFGVQTVVLSENTVDCFNPKVMQATMGSIFHLNLHQVDLPRFLEEKKAEGARIVVTALEGESMEALKQSDKDTILVIGSEAHGASDNVLKLADHRLTIQGYGQAESLNAAIACGVVLYEWTKG